jgi:hypothetical protein
MTPNTKKRALHNGRLWFLFIPLISMIIGQTSCKRLIEIPAPEHSIAQNSIYSTDVTATSVLTGIYSSMNLASGPFTGTKSITLFAGQLVPKWR